MSSLEISLRTLLKELIKDMNKKITKRLPNEALKCNSKCKIGPKKINFQIPPITSDRL